MLQKLQILINNVWEELDLPKTDIALTMQVNDVAELKDRQASYSQSISLPKTANNIKVFEFITDLQTINNVPYKYYPCCLLINDINIFGNDSVITITEVDNESIKVQVLGSVCDIFTRMQNVLIKDLPFDYLGAIKYDGKTSLSGINTKVLVKTFETFIAKNETNKYTLGKWFYVNLYDLIKKVVSYFGFTLNDEVLNDDKINTYLSLPSLIASEASYNSLSEKKQLRKGTHNITNHYAHTYYHNLPFTDYKKTANLTYDAPHPDNVTWGGSFDALNYWTYRVTFTGVLNIDFYLKYLIEINGHPKLHLGIVGYLNGDEIFYESWKDYSIVRVLKFSHNVNVSKGDVITIKAFVVVPKEKGMLLTFYNYDNHLSFNPVQCDIVPFGGILSVRDQLTDFKSCYDLFKAFINLYGLTVSVKESTLYCYTMQKVYDNIPSARDWSQKLLKDDYNLSFTYGSYAQTNIIKYKDNEVLTDKTDFIIENETLEKEKDAVTFDFYAGEIASQNNKTLPYNPIYADTEGRLTYNGGKSQVAKEINIKHTQTLLPLPAKYLKTKYYNKLIEMLQKCRVLEAYFYLNDYDLTDFDFSVPVYLQQTGQYYYVNKINNYISGQKTKVTLIQL